MTIFLVILVNLIAVAVAVLIHYAFLYRLTKRISSMPAPHPYRIVIGVFGALVAHVIEVWVFALAYFIQIHYLAWGKLIATIENTFTDSLADYAYFSFTVFTTLGFGDIQPVGDVRYLTGIESLTGLVLITWTASFLYLEMQRYWTRSIHS